MWNSHKQDLLHAPIWFSLYITFIKVHPIPIQNNCLWIEIKKSPKYKLNDNIGDLLKATVDIIAMTPREPLGLCCIHIVQLMTHPTVYTLPFTLQLCYKPLGVLQRVTKIQKVHISSQDVSQKWHTYEERGVHLRISFRHLLMNFEKPKKSEFCKNKIKKPWRYHHFTQMYQKPQSGTVPEIWSNTIFFYYLGPFFALYCPLTP